MENSVLPSWGAIFRRMGEREPRGGRARCPIHGGDSPTSLSVNEDRGLYHCFVCHAAGDKVDFVQRVQGTHFKGALAFLGVQVGGRSPKPDLAAARQRAALEAVRDWTRQTGRRVRHEHLRRQRLVRYAQEKLAADPDDALGWSLLAVAYDDEARLEFLLDEIDLCRTDAERLQAWRTYCHEV